MSYQTANPQQEHTGWEQSSIGVGDEKALTLSKVFLRKLKAQLLSVVK